MVTLRIVVVAGPDVGAEQDVPREGLSIGRGEQNTFRLRDLAVSRAHAQIVARGEDYVLAPVGPAKILVNGQTIVEHTLADGDEIHLGKTRLMVLPVRHTYRAGKARVTVDIAPTELFAAVTPGFQDRSRAHLAVLAGLGEALRGVTDAHALSLSACAGLSRALETCQVALFLKDKTGRLGLDAAVPDASGLAVDGGDIHVQRVLHGHRALVVVEGDEPRLLAPIPGAPGRSDAAGLILVVGSKDKDLGPPDLELVACVAHLVGAAFEGLSARDTLARDNRALADRLGGTPVIIGDSEGTQRVLQAIDKVARADTTVLILGESGVGKELVASAIHERSRRRGGPFVCVNCAALSESVIESELFGHEKGAFTGATERRVGRFELADGGTLFLDEVGEIPIHLQAKFLRALEDRRVERVGSGKSIAVDVRVVAATNRDLREMMDRGQMREDLYYRLAVIRIDVPPLRERSGDIEAIATSLGQRMAKQMGRRFRGFSPEAVGALRAYGWPGNVRELRNTVEHALVLGEGDLVGLGDLPEHVAATPTMRAAAAAPSETGEARSLRDLEREGIVAALRAMGGNKQKAAGVLGIDRTTLYKKLKDYGISDV